MIDVEIDDRGIREALLNLLAVTSNLDDALTEIGEELVERTKRRFGTMTAPSGRRWADNSPVTIERKGRNQPLTGYGTLGEQIHAQLLGDNTLVVGSNMEYAAMQQFGGTKAEFPHLWGDIPARPFLGISADDRDEILAILRAHLRDAVG